MAYSIDQITAASYPAVLNKMRTPENQWAESALMNSMERMGMIDRIGLGPTIEIVLDYQRNSGTDFLATDLTPTSITKTEVLTAASYSVAELSVPVTWSKGDEAKNPEENQKVSLSRALMENAIDSHDDAIEEALFATSTDGFLGMATLIPTNGLGTVGGIDASVETMWRNPTDSYQADGSDMEAVFTEVYNSAAKGSGSTMVTKLMVSGSEAHSLFESTQQGQQRYGDADVLKAGFKTIQFKSANYIFSQHGGTKVYFLNPKCFKLVVSKQYFRDKGKTNEFNNANGFNFKIYSALQAVTSNKSRLAVVDEA